ncbi:MAG: lysostaphin resistance A-like protein [Planctomycetota bacterium]
MALPLSSLVLLAPLAAGFLLWAGSQKALWRPLAPRHTLMAPGLDAALYATALFVFTPALLSTLVPSTGDTVLHGAVASFASNLLLIPLCFGLWRLRGRLFPWGQVSMIRGLGVTLMAMFTLFPLVYLGAEINREWALALGISTPHPMLEYLRHPQTSPKAFAFVSLGVCLAVPLAEELLFRGLWQGAVLKVLGLPASLFLPSLLFALVHPAETCLPMFVFALGLGFLAHLSSSVLPGMLLHIMFNGLSIVDVGLYRFGFPWPV